MRFALVNKKLADLTPDPKNANKGTERGSQMVEDSLRTYGAGRSILIDKHGNIIAGNKTVENAGAIGLEDVLVVQTDGKKLVAVQRMDLDLSTDKAAKELAIADNRAGQVSLDWDPAVLKELDVDLAKFWSEDELGALFQDSTAALLTDEDDVPELPAKAKTKLGDLYVLGKHRLLCGDATSAADVERLMGGRKADMVWTDPPYNVEVTSRVGTKGVSSAEARKLKGALKIENDSMDGETFRKFLQDSFVAAVAQTEAGGAIYVSHADMQGHNFRQAFLDAGWTLRSCLVWIKNSLVLGRGDYQWMHEPILYGWAPGAAHKWHSDRKQTTLLEFDRPTRSTEHPTMKPVALIEYCIGNSSLPGQKVLDLFGGSGSTLIACEKTGRSAYLMELDPRYCDVIVKRWEDATGKKGERVAHGKAA